MVREHTPCDINPLKFGTCFMVLYWYWLVFANPPWMLGNYVYSAVLGCNVYVCLIFVIVLFKSFIYFLNFLICFLNQFLRELCWNLQHYSLKDFSHWMALVLLLKIIWLYMYGVYFWAILFYSILLEYMPILMSLPYCFDYCSFVGSFKIRNYKSFDFLKILFSLFRIPSNSI